MKPLKEFFNPDKANLLFDLFPEEIPTLIEFLDSHGAYIIGNADMHRQKWESGFCDFDFWLHLATQVRGIIKEEGVRLHKKRNVFTDQLFDIPVVFFVIDAITKYAAHEERNPKFCALVKILFES